MFRSFHIQNFRCFRDLKLDNLERVNLIAGQNNVGKTALLEAIFLHLGFRNPGLGLSINALRGVRRIKTNIKEAYSTLFINYETETIIELKTHDDEANDCLLQIHFAEPETTQLASSIDDSQEIDLPTTTHFSANSLVFRYHEQDGETVSRAFVSGDNIQIENQPGPTEKKRGVFFTTHERFLQIDSERFSTLEATNRQNEVVSALRILEPRLNRLAILILGGVPIIHGDIGIERLLPLPMMGEGMTRLLSILLAIANTEHGVILIDEIENGLHYSVMAKVWTAIAQAARDADVQIFATTHSWECITAAHQAFSESETYDFRLHRLDRIGEDIRAVTLNQKMLDTAIQSGLEVR
jgi:AAA15 family ATPase/GTPase